MLAAWFFASVVAGAPPVFELRDAELRVHADDALDSTSRFSLEGRVERTSSRGDAVPTFALIPALPKAGAGCGLPLVDRIFRNGLE